MEIKAINLIRSLAIWGAFITIALVIPWGAFLAVHELFGITIVLTWKTWLSFWALVLISRLDFSLKVHP